MQFKRLVGLLVLAALSSGCGSSQPTPTTHQSKSASPPTTAHSSANPCAVPAQAPLPPSIPADFATALAFAPDGRLFYAERKGTVEVWQQGAAHAFASVNTVTTERGGGYSERGLLGLALSPAFDTDHFVYAFYSDPNYTQQHVIRWTDCDGVSSDPTVIVTLPSGADCCHKGGRIAFGPDGKLYVSLGDEHTASAAQNTSDVRGKILRYNADGSIPADNPFGASDPVWAYGLRNPFGLAFGQGGNMLVTANGPSGDAGSPPTGYDVLFLNVTRGERLQWPRCYGDSHPLQSSDCQGVAPDWSSEQSTYVPTGIAFIDQSGPAGLAGHVVLCSYDKGMQIVSGPPTTVSAGSPNCTLDVIQGADHAVYYSNTTSITRVA